MGDSLVAKDLVRSIVKRIRLVVCQFCHGTLSSDRTSPQPTPPGDTELLVSTGWDGMVLWKVNRSGRISRDGASPVPKVSDVRGTFERGHVDGHDGPLQTEDIQSGKKRSGKKRNEPYEHVSSSGQ